MGDFGKRCVPLRVKFNLHSSTTPPPPLQLLMYVAAMETGIQLWKGEYFLCPQKLIVCKSVTAIVTLEFPFYRGGE